MEETPVANQIFVNLPVKDLTRSVEFFAKLGYAFDAQFTDANATCMIVGENIYVMLLVESFFATFTRKPVADAKRSTEAILALALASREQVDEHVAQAVAAGGTASPKQDHGWMYQHGFEDLDGHLWEVFWMDPKGMPA
jgi:predicted lactoylglutathione lyase